jgi:excisionase family DNA binding protein
MRMAQQQLLAISEAARILRLSEDTTRWLADTGALAAVRASNGVRIFERRDVEALAVQRSSRERGGQ